MKFLFPEILYALAAIAIPILVHLFNFRKFKKVSFSNVSFLKEVKQETKAKSKLKHLLILFSRILAITFIVFAFAQPYIPVDEQSKVAESKVVSIFLDNSFSMQGNTSEGPMLEVNRNKALAIVDQYAPTDKFQLLTQDFEGRHQRLVNKDEMIELLGDVELSPQSNDLSTIIERQKDALLQADGDRMAYVLSDFQESVTDLENCEVDTNFQVVFIPTEREAESNVFIDSLWFSTPVRQLNEAEELKVRLRSTGSEEVQKIPVELSINGVQKAINSMNVTEEAVDSSLFFTNSSSGRKAGLVSISDYPITFDDDFFLSYDVQSQITVHEIKGRSVVRDFVRNIFADDPFYVFDSDRNGDFTFEKLNTTDLLILNQLNEISGGLASELEKFIESGGTLLIIPAKEIGKESYNGLLARFTEDRIDTKVAGEVRVNSMNLDHYIYSGVFDEVPENIDLPRVKSHYSTKSGTRSNGLDLLNLNTGNSFFRQYNHESGKAYLWLASLDQEVGNLAQHAVFVTTMLRVSEYSRPASKPYYTIGKDKVAEFRNISIESDQVFRLRKFDSTEEYIPAHRQIGGAIRIFLENAISDAGHYYLTLGSDTLAVLAFNYPREESLLESKDIGEIREGIDRFGLNYSILNSTIEGISKSVNELSKGRRLWYSMIIMALIFLALEVLLIKFWKRS